MLYTIIAVVIVLVVVGLVQRERRGAPASDLTPETTTTQGVDTTDLQNKVKGLAEESNALNETLKDLNAVNGDTNALSDTQKDLDKVSL